MYPLSPTPLARRAPLNVLQRLAIIGIIPRDLQHHDVAMVVDGQMELEAQEPAHGCGPAGPALGNTLFRLIRPL